MRRTFALVFLWAVTASANPPDIYGFGARSIGMAGAMTGAVNDTTANFYNPAALTRNRFLQIDTGYLFTHTALHFNQQDAGVDEGNGTQLGVIVPGQVGPVGLAFGLSIFLPDARLSRLRALPQHRPRFVVYDNRPQRVFINTNLAIQPLPWLHIGGGVAFLTETRGTLQLEGVLFSPGKERSVLTAGLDVHFRTIRYPSAGLLFTPNEQWTIGLTYREEVRVELDIAATVEGIIRLNNVLDFPGSFTLSSFSPNLYTPRQLWLGTAWKPIDELLISLDVGWLNWATYTPPTSTIQIDLDVEGLDLENLIPPSDTALPADFHDIVALRAGVEGSISLGSQVVLDLRTGYAFEPTPAPNQPGRTNFVDSHKHTIAVGLGLTIRDWNPWVAAPITVDVAGQAILLEDRDYQKDDPTDLIGDYSAGGQLFTFASTVRWRF